MLFLGGSEGTGGPCCRRRGFSSVSYGVMLFFGGGSEGTEGHWGPLEEGEGILCCLLWGCASFLGGVRGHWGALEAFAVGGGDSLLSAMGLCLFLGGQRALRAPSGNGGGWRGPRFSAGSYRGCVHFGSQGSGAKVGIRIPAVTKGRRGGRGGGGFGAGPPGLSGQWVKGGRGFTAVPSVGL